MKLLLDTHTLLWSIGKSSELSEKVKNELENANNDILVSAVSLWEISIKFNLGKLVIGSLNIMDIPQYCDTMNFLLIPLDPRDALESSSLPQKEKHKDPFDRMLIYQCISNDYLFISKDSRLKAYKKDGLKYLW
jgi:PIN domain nuclease of toxin-antitoxin system